uniref:Uncharacterized protein n=1 Tax=Pyropia haitanensis TaxID=1262161 RepID=M9PQN0_PYRHA|nr:hypothetical protein 32 [Neoporphyra haitanensis]AGG36990.1 hypothetical protein 32 [Neoporphyra haitanensis]
MHYYYYTLKIILILQKVKIYFFNYIIISQ